MDAAQLEDIERHVTPAALVTVIGATIAGLLRLDPFDVRVANSIAQNCVAASKLLETSDLASLLERLEGAAAHLAPPLYNGARPRPGMVP